MASSGDLTLYDVVWPWGLQLELVRQTYSGQGLSEEVVGKGHVGDPDEDVEEDRVFITLEPGVVMSGSDLGNEVFYYLRKASS